MPNTPDDERRINAIRALSIDTVQKANSGHPGLPLGAAALAYTLWTRHLNHDPSDPNWLNRDRFLLSAGHGSALLYSLLYLSGYSLTLDDLKSFRQLGSRTPGHPEYRHTAGVESTTGPLGQGFANGVGIALAEAQLAAVYNEGRRITDHHTYILCGDGDLMEGISYEAASLAGHLRLGKVIVLYDDNHVSLAGPTSITFTEDVVKRFEAAEWHVRMIDREHGNDVTAIDHAIAEAKADERPSIICIQTEIGFDSPVAGTYKAHGEALGVENVRKTKEKLGWPTEPDFFVPDEILSWWRENGKRGKPLHDAWNAEMAEWKEEHPKLAEQLERVVAGRAPENVEWPKFTEENGSIATRDAGGLVMNALAKAMPELIGGSADLDPSTKTYLKERGDFTASTRAGRNIHYGVREHAMAGISNGIALHGGLTPFCATFFNFVDYAKPALRLAALSQLREVFIFTHDSVFLGEDGPTHQPIEQLAQLRAMPNLVTFRPADSLETLEAWKYVVETERGPTALVLSRQTVPFLGERTFDIRRGAYILRDSEGTPELIFIATGSEVALAVAAAALLKAQGTEARVLSAPSLELFGAQDEAYRERILPSAVKARVSIEAAATFGWHRWIGDRGIAIGLDHFGTSAPAPAIAKEYGFTPEAIAKVAGSLLTRV